jgi:hemerythrin-like domain-containing protein
MKSTTSLKSDHEIILSALHVLDEIASAVETGRVINPHDIRALLTFFREFADGSHHVKEEAILFPALMHADMTFQKGPLQAMNCEHEHGRMLNAAMANAFDEMRNDEFVRNARRYIKLLRDHIEKENCVLFEAADRILDDDEDNRIALDFEHFDKEVFGVRRRNGLVDVADELAAKYLTVLAK